MTGETERPAPDLVGLARLSGLELSQTEAAELRPHYDQLQRWLGVLRRHLDEGEEPATMFLAAHETDEYR